MNDFNTLGISEPILRAITRLGFSSPTPVQKQAIPVLLDSGRDVVALARTGTGKTAAFGIPLLQKITGSVPGPEALVLSPTRELCRQITKDLQTYASFMEKTGITAVYGGASMDLQIRDLKAKPRVVVATPGRLIDHLKRGTVTLSDIKTLVLDEADEMLSMGFRDELETILSSVPEARQTCMFSATMSKEVRSIAERHLHEPVEIAVEDETVLQIEHTYAFVHAGDRLEALRRFAALDPDMYGIVFCRTRDTAREVADLLSRDGCNADALHGELSQAQRDYVMGRFRKGYIKMLVATDVAARGLDVSGLSHVIHLGLPEDPDAYVHRSGRTGRAGKSGISIAIVSPRERMLMKTIERKIGSPMKRVEVPDGNDILRARINRILEKLEAGETDAAIPETLIKEANERLGTMENENIIKGILALTLGNQLSAYGKATKLTAPDREQHTAGRNGPYRTGRPGTFDRKNGGKPGAGYDNRGNGDTFRQGRFGKPADSDRRQYRSFEHGDAALKNRDRDGGRDFARPATGGMTDGRMIEAKLPFGDDDGLTRSMLLELVNKQMGRVRFPIGRIRILRHFSVLEVPEHIARELATKFKGVEGGKIPL